MYNCTIIGKCEHDFIVKVGERYGHPTKKIARGQYSDDTEMMLCILRSIVKKKGKYVNKDVIKRYIQWTKSNQPSVGTNTKLLFRVDTKTKNDPTGYEHYCTKWQSVTELTSKDNWQTKTSESFQSDGSLMRCGPLATLSTADDIRKAVREDVWCSNPSRFVLSIEMIYVWMIRKAMEGASAVTIWNHLITNILPTLQNKKLCKLIQKIVDGDKEPTEADVKKGWLVHGFAMALVLLRKMTRVKSDDGNKNDDDNENAKNTDDKNTDDKNTDDKNTDDKNADKSKNDKKFTFMKVMDWAIRKHPNSDTDTNACIVGYLIGGLLGWSKMHQEPLVAHNWPIIVASTSTAETQVPRSKLYRIDDLSELETFLVSENQHIKPQN